MQRPSLGLPRVTLVTDISLSLGTLVYELFQEISVPVCMRMEGNSHKCPRWVTSPCTCGVTQGEDVSWVANWTGGWPCSDSHWAKTCSTDVRSSCPVSFSVDWHQVWPMIAFWRFEPWWPLHVKPLLPQLFSGDNHSTGLCWGLNQVDHSDTVL